MARAGVVAALVPVLLICLLVDRPAYRLLSAAQGAIIPVYETFADGVSWPVRAVGRAVQNFRELAGAKKENKKLRALLDAALARNTECDLALATNQNLAQKLEIVQSQPRKVAAARVIHDNSGLDRSGFLIGKGEESGIIPGMAVMSFDGFFVGIVAESHAGGAFVRGLRDSKSNIPVRIAGTDVFGFLRGSGAAAPELEFMSDPEFEITDGLKLYTHGIKNSLPNGIPVGEIKGKFRPGAEIGSLAEVMVVIK
jgi:cell shape-determining protein MreC